MKIDNGQLTIDNGQSRVDSLRLIRDRVVHNPLSIVHLLAFFAALAVLCAASTGAQAGVYTYANSAEARNINCGILLADSAGQTLPPTLASGPDLPAPYPFYILDQRADIKPNGWHIVNPLAPSVVTTDLQANYPAYTLGQPVTPNMAVYWQISLPQVAQEYADGADVLSQFNLLVIHTHLLIGLSRNEREALRQYVDQGGTLWVEDCEGATTEMPDTDAGANTPAGLFIDVVFHDNAGTGGYAIVPDNDHRHPLTTIPYFLSQLDLDNLGDKDVSNYYMSSMNGATTSPDLTDLLTVVGNSAYQNATGQSLPYVSAGDYGAGHIIIDNADVIDSISNPVASDIGGPGNSVLTSGFCPTDVQAALPQDLKFLVNELSWSSDTASNTGANTRRNGVEPAPLVGDGLVPAWTYPDSRVNATTAANGGLQYTSYGAAISGNIAYATTADSLGGGAAAQNLHAFDLIPQEDLDNSGDTDNGDFFPITNPTTFPVDPETNIPFLGDWSRGLSYDELWVATVPGAKELSAPAVASLPGGQEGNVGYFGSVMVETDNGEVYIYNATDNPQTAALSPAAPANNFLEAILPNTAAKGTWFNANPALSLPVPAPVYYRGWLIAAQPLDPTTNTAGVYVHNFASGTDETVQLQPNPATSGVADTTPIVGQIAVASIPSNDGAKGGEDIVCYVTTQANAYALFLGSRDERLSPVGGDFSTKLSILTSAANVTTNVTLWPAPEDQFQAGGNPAFVYMNANPTWVAGQALGSPQFRGAQITAGAPPTIGPVSTFGGDQTTAFGDYDVAIPNTAMPPFCLSRHQITAQLYNPGGEPLNNFIQGIAVGPDNVLYMTVNEGTNVGPTSYIEAISEQNPGLAGPGTVIKWRFTLVDAPTDADGITYQFAGYYFIGAPVVDGNYVYAMATDGTSSDVFCFNRNPTITLALNSNNFTSLNTVTQADENGVTQTIMANQYFVNDATTGNVTFRNFSQSSSGSYQIQPDLCVPLPVNATIETSSQNGDDAGATTSQSYELSTSGSGSPLLNWYFPFSTPNNTGATPYPPSPLAEFGNSLYFAVGASPTSNGVNDIYAIPTNDITSSEINGSSRQLTLKPPQTALTCGELTSGMIASGAYVLAPGNAVATTPATVNGTITGGIEGAVYGLTMIADNNRLIEIDPTGNAVWSLDSTSQQLTVGGVQPDEQTPGEAPTGPTGATPAATVVSLNRPSSVSELTSDDILFADSGNSRCVRVDRSGNLLWELTAFQDPSGLLAPGQPLTLNHPSSVVEWRDQYVNAGVTPNVNYLIEHYLVADTGNFRVLEVDDVYTENINGTLAIAQETEPSGAVIQLTHILHWVTHTYDQLGREYRYVSAAPYTDAAGNPGVVAAIANKQIAPLNEQFTPTTGTFAGDQIPILDAASKDGVGSTVVVFSSNTATGGSGYEPTPNVDVTGAATGTAYTLDVPIYPGTAWTYSPTYVIATNATAGPWAYPYNGLPNLLISQVEFTPTAGAAATTLPLRDLRYITVYLPIGAQTGANNVMIADDDGVFDGPVVVAAPGVGMINAITSNGNPTGFSFTLADYSDMVTAAQGLLGQSATPYPANVFIPSSAQHLDNGDYLITNGAAAGDARPWDPSLGVGNNNQSGGCVFEVVPSTKDGSPVTLFGRAIPGTGTPATGPQNSSPLTQPAFAYRSQ
jgi:hypothetical protein